MEPDYALLSQSQKLDNKGHLQFKSTMRLRAFLNWIFHTGIGAFFLVSHKASKCKCPWRTRLGKRNSTASAEGLTHFDLSQTWQGGRIVGGGSEEIPMLLECNIPLKLLAGGDIVSIMTSKSMEAQQVERKQLREGRMSVSMGGITRPDQALF